MDDAQRFELLHRIGMALSAEHNRARLIEMILLEAKTLCRADGGTLYIRTDDDRLRFAMVHNDSLNIALGGHHGDRIDFDPLPMVDPETGTENHGSVATHSALRGSTVKVDDAYAEKEFDFSSARAFDAEHGYLSKSFLAIPLKSSQGRVIAVLQLINARNSDGNVVAFDARQVSLVEALASQAGLALDNQMLLDGQKKLLEAFIKLIATAIDAKSPYTGGHCERVPYLVEMLARAACEDETGAFADFNLDEEEWYELRIASWLHDCGKIVTPVHVMDKATKLETITDRIESIRNRFEVLIRDAEIAHLNRVIDGADERVSASKRDHEHAALREELAFLERCNIGGEFLDDADKERIKKISQREMEKDGENCRLLSDEEVENLAISRGTLTETERVVINGHMVQTIKMLEALPFPANLQRVPEYAGGHHERMDGKGYPKGIFAGDMSTPARIMAIADVFEALTAQDRPYKRGKTLSESMNVMAKMKEFNHLDPELFDLFVSSGVYREYGQRFLPPVLLDEVDEEALLAIKPRPYELPALQERRKRWKDFLPMYADEARKGERVVATQNDELRKLG